MPPPPPPPPPLLLASFAQGRTTATPTEAHLLPCCRVDLQVIKRSGTPQEVWLAERVEPVRPTGPNSCRSASAL